MRPLSNRHIGARTGEYRAHRSGEHRDQPVSNTPGLPQVGHTRQNNQQVRSHHIHDRVRRRIEHRVPPGGKQTDRQEKASGHGGTQMIELA
jgi:hypothetical protein